MTVAAVVLVPEAALALIPLDGVAAVRRVVRAAWSGGALPTVVVSPQAPPPGLASVVEDLDVTLVAPDPNEPHGIAWFVHGLRVAMGSVAETRAALLWPVKMAWLDPETVTSLVEAHGAAPQAIVRPSFDGVPGFPILVPSEYLAALDALSGKHGEEAVAALVAQGVAQRILEVGDPGTIHDSATPRESMPRFEGPPEPAGGPPPEWNAAVAPRRSEPA
jgi:CTP:molybdopterin cytidylyltransferase MocA